MPNKLCNTVNLYIGEHLPFEDLLPGVRHQLGKHASEGSVAEKAAQLIVERMAAVGILQSPATKRKIELTPAARELAEQDKFDHILRWFREGWDELEFSYFIARWPNSHNDAMGAQVFRWLRRNEFLDPLLARLVPGEPCAQLLIRVRELGYDPNSIHAADLHIAMKNWYFLRNPHNSAVPIDPSGEQRRWQCTCCGQVGADYNALNQTECTHVYPPCEFCFKVRECAADCPGIAAILRAPEVHLAGSVETEGNN
jgi:hypothetical protein